MAMITSYALTTQEEATAVEVGYQRQKPYFGDPTRNINYSEGDLGSCGNMLLLLVVN